MDHNLVSDSRLPVVLSRAGRDRAAFLITEHRAWSNSTGHLRGGPMRTWLPRTTWLPRYHWDAVLASTYVIWSFDTPIVWRRTDGVWEMPDECYSPTTTRHQSIVRGLVRHEPLRMVA